MRSFFKKAGGSKKTVLFRAADVAICRLNQGTLTEREGWEYNKPP